jgi:hypothetical protein
MLHIYFNMLYLLYFIGKSIKVTLLCILSKLCMVYNCLHKGPHSLLLNSVEDQGINLVISSLHIIQISRVLKSFFLKIFNVCIEIAIFVVRGKFRMSNSTKLWHILQFFVIWIAHISNIATINDVILKLQFFASWVKPWISNTMKHIIFKSYS